LLFETLSQSPELFTIGGESHQVIEAIPGLRPVDHDWDSNRLDARDATPERAGELRKRFFAGLHDRDGRPATGAVRMLEKTPKNALRVPFFQRVFPDARFVFLWRDPRENLASIIEAWRAGRWVTYPSLPGWDGPWSLLLPPHWQALAGQPIADIAAWQWAETHRVLLGDLERLGNDRWLAVCYADLVAAPAKTLARICRFLDVDPHDSALTARLAAPLPPSRFTLSAPSPDKWRQHEAEIARVLPRLEPVWSRLRALPRDQR
jgi:hypothetical protein